MPIMSPGRKHENNVSAIKVKFPMSTSKLTTPKTADESFISFYVFLNTTKFTKTL